MVLRDRAIVELCAAALVGCAVLGGRWVRQGLISGEMPFDVWWKPQRTEQPALFWLAIICQVSLTAFLAVGGLSLVIWGAFG